MLDGIYDITESHAFSDLCMKFRNMDFWRRRDMLMDDGKIALQEIFTHMDSEERDIIINKYEDRNLFKQIQQEAHQEAHQHDNKQLTLF